MKYKLTQETLEYNGHILHRIEALKDFGLVRKGDKGGFVESESNLSQDSNCWIHDNAKVYGNAKVYDNAWVGSNANVYGNTIIYGNAKVCGSARVYGYANIYGNTIVCGNANIYGIAQVFENARVCEDAQIFGYAEVCGNAMIIGDAKVESIGDYIVFKNWWSSGRHLTWTRSNNKWKVGCFYGTGEELIEKAYKDSKLSGSEYKRLVDYVESILQKKKGDKK